MGDCQKAYETLKLKLMTETALGLPEVQKEFKLYLQEKQGLDPRRGLTLLSQLRRDPAV